MVTSPHCGVETTQRVGLSFWTILKLLAAFYYEVTVLIEVWKDILGYEGYYQISNLGNVRSLDRYVRNGKGTVRFVPGKLRKLDLLADGYLGISLEKEGRVKYFKIHRLVAEAFIPNPENKPEVNHKDGDKTNPTVNNLEWATRSDNMDHAWRTGLAVKGFCKEAYDKSLERNRKPVVWLETGIEYPSISEAARSSGIPDWRIYTSIKQNRTIKGTTFRSVHSL